MAIEKSCFIGQHIVGLFGLEMLFNLLLFYGHVMVFVQVPIEAQSKDCWTDMGTAPSPLLLDWSRTIKALLSSPV